MAYLHGAYAFGEPSGLSVPASSGTLPVYFGTAPVHQLPDYAGLRRLPILLGSRARMLASMGYSDDWVRFTLGEPAFLHFLSAAPSAPVVVVNALDPDNHRKAAKTSVEAIFAGGSAVVETTTAIVHTVRLTADGEEPSIGAAYDETGTRLLLTDPKKQLSGPQSVDFFEVDSAAVTSAVMSAMILETIKQVYERVGRVPSLLTAPGWSDARAVNDALKGASKEINGHFNAFVFGDIAASVRTLDAVRALKTTESRNAPVESPCWPMGTDGERYYHLSTLAAHRSQLVDGINGDIPYETTSNKPVLISGLVVKGEDGKYQSISFDKVEANELNAAGIKTAIFWAGSWRLWGPHTGAFDANSTNVPEEIFDSGVRMLQYLGNNFQLAYGDEVDKPMHRARIDSILDAEQEKLDRLVNLGALLFGKIDFIPEDNPESDLMSGQFVFDTGYTTTPPARVIINRYRYTAAGLQLLTSGGEAGG